MAEIYNYTSDKVISGTSDDDRIFNGNEVLYGSTTAYKPGGDKVTVQSKAGNDYVWNYSDYTKINSGTGDDTVEHHGSKASIVTSAGNDSVLSGGNDATISTGDGDDTIYNVTGYNASINAGAGDDVITNGDYIFHYDNVTIMAGRGNDKVNLSEESSLYNVLQYVDGDGDDTVYGYSSDDKIQIINSSYTTTTSGNDVIIKVGDGKITLKNAKDKQLSITTMTMDIEKNNGDDSEDDDNNNQQENFNIPSEALTYNRHRYYIYSNVVNTWEEAQAYCQSRGGHLAVINNEAENTALFNYMKNQGYNTAYFGFSDATQEGTWTWVNGEPVTFTNWASGEPNSENSNEDYASFYYKFSDGKWNDGNFNHGTINDANAFICEWDTPGDNNTPADDGGGDNPLIPTPGDDDDNTPTNDSESYWTLEDLQTFLHAINYYLPPSSVKLSAWTDISEKFTGILKSAIDIANGNTSVTDLKSNFIELVGTFASIKGDVKSLKGQDSTLWALAGSGIGGVASWIKAFDVAKIVSTEEKEDREKLQKEIDKAVEGTADIVSDISGVIIDKIFESNLSTSELRSLAAKKLNLKLKFGARAAIALVMVGYYGANQYRESIQKYSAEELPLAMTAEASFVDVIVSALHGGAHYVSLGLDDLAFKGLRWAAFKITGQKPVNSDKDYMEWIGEVIKRGIFGSSSAGDTIEIDHDGEPPLYAQGGDDYIRNVFSNVKIYGGDGNDTIFSHEGARRNYLNGNAGRDYIFALDTKSTAIGASENDILMSSGDGNSISGGEGIDFILLENASENIVNGGTETDIISIENSKNTVIYYAKGDGNDIIFGYDENDTIHVAGKIKYTVTENGQDVYIKVGDDTIILKDAVGKNINIENRDTADNPLDDINPFDINPVINNTISRISARAAENVEMTDINSLDNITNNRNSILTFTENSGSGIQNADLRSAEYSQIVSLEGGNQNIQFNDEDGNVAIIGASATGSKNIIFGNGDDLGIFYSPDANIRATVGSGRDSIITDNNARVRVDMTNSDEAKIIPYSGRIILDNYDPDSRAEIVIPDVTDITGAIKGNSIQLVGNEVRPNSSTRIQLNDSTDANIVNLSTERGDTQKVGFTGINGGAVDASKLRGNFLLKGNYAENASDKQKRKPSTLISGNGHDTILAGARDFVDGGNGKNQIFLTPYNLRQIKDGATIVSSGNDRNTIHGFHEGFGYDGDVIQVKDFNNLKFKFDTDGLLLTSNDSRIKFDGIGTASATTDDSTNSLGTDRAELIQITNGSSTMRTAVAQTNQSILVQEDDYITPNAFFGNRSGLNFSEYSGNVEINLADGTGKLDMWDATFQGINKLQAGNGMSTLIGDDTRNTLIAGTGYTSMWGGAGNDKLIGKGNSADKDGRTTFFFFAGDGRDVISDFTFLTPNNRYDGIDDRINVGDSDINDAYSAGNNVVVVFDQNSYLILEDAVGKDFRIANMIAKVDRNIAYDGLANCYVASGGSSLTVDSTVKSAEIWLDNSHETQFFGTIRTLDASAVEGNTSLVGNEFDNTIIAGQGDSSLWGGFASSNDLLIGGNSRNTFFYCMGNGNDTVQGTNDKDFVILSDVSLDQIIETSITADSVSIRFNNGGSLQIQGTSDVTYQLADGSKYSANHQRLEWDSR